MTVSRRAKVRLVLKSLTFVTNEQEANRGPNEQTLVVDQEVVQKAVAYAEALGWRNTDRSLQLRHMPRAVVTSFVAKLREALEAQQVVSSGPKGRASAKDALREFFGTAANRRQLVRVLDFLQNGGELAVENQ